ncbi:hypothetical protein E2562_028040 [Oryza meyeriana var. granulata]|uniref:Uncharacterized protein n=1 Tax=Oryza meyeriana var. granulata TaxID=110450 RepID=A0A6G1C0G6_9ORYZ|nr:hypothetical protein E2562_028040 [Oryza meyeriana var. granulata]
MSSYPLLVWRKSIRFVTCRPDEFALCAVPNLCANLRVGHEVEQGADGPGLHARRRFSRAPLQSAYRAVAASFFPRAPPVSRRETSSGMAPARPMEAAAEPSSWDRRSSAPWPPRCESGCPGCASPAARSESSDDDGDSSSATSDKIVPSDASAAHDSSSRWIPESNEEEKEN